MEPNPKRQVAHLRGIPPRDDLGPFRDLDSREVEMIAPYLERVLIPAGLVLFSEGDPGDFLAIVVAGRLQATKKTEFPGRGVVVAHLTRGTFAGELAMVDERPRPITVKALEDSEILILRRTAFDALIKANPELGLKLMRRITQVLSIRVRAFGNRLTHLF